MKFHCSDVVFIVDKDPIVRRDISILLNTHGCSTSTHDSPDTFLKSLQYLDESLIQCAILDVNLSGMSGFELHQRLLSNNICMPVCFTSSHGSVSDAVSAFKRGADDFLLKPLNEVDVFRVASKMLSRCRDLRSSEFELKRVNALMGALTGRELEVLDFVVTGFTSRHIATKLEISVKTVESHRTALMTKLQVDTTNQLIHFMLTSIKARIGGSKFPPLIVHSCSTPYLG